MRNGDTIRVYVDNTTIKEVVFSRWLSNDTIEYKLDGKLKFTHYKSIVV